jgi:hypothetical protein
MNQKRLRTPDIHNFDVRDLAVQGIVIFFIVVLISDAPEIYIDEELVASGKDYETELKCVVHAEPAAKVYWLKDNEPITELGHVKTSADGNKYFYHIQRTQVSDFGKYKCMATNSKGTTNSKEIELTGMFLKFSEN